MPLLQSHRPPMITHTHTRRIRLVADMIGTYRLSLQLGLPPAVDERERARSGSAATPSATTSDLWELRARDCPRAAAAPPGPAGPPPAGPGRAVPPSRRAGPVRPPVAHPTPAPGCAARASARRGPARGRWSPARTREDPVRALAHRGDEPVVEQVRQPHLPPAGVLVGLAGGGAVQVHRGQCAVLDHPGEKVGVQRGQPRQLADLGGTGRVLDVGAAAQQGVHAGQAGVLVPGAPPSLAARLVDQLQESRADGTQRKGQRLGPVAAGAVPPVTGPPRPPRRIRVPAQRAPLLVVGRLWQRPAQAVHGAPRPHLARPLVLEPPGPAQRHAALAQPDGGGGQRCAALRDPLGLQAPTPASSRWLAASTGTPRRTPGAATSPWSRPARSRWRSPTPPSPPATAACGAPGRPRWPRTPPTSVPGTRTCSPSGTRATAAGVCWCTGTSSAARWWCTPRRFGPPPRRSPRWSRARSATAPR